MDVTEIAKALQTDLNFYKIKIQVKRKGSQLHVLTTRAEENDVDYSLLMELVRKNLEKLPLQDVNDFVIYGRVAGAKQPEWQEKVEISPQLPLIELDIEDDLDRELNFNSSVASVSSAAMVKDSIDIDDLLPDLSEPLIDADTDIFVRSRENSAEKLTSTPSDVLEVPESVNLQPPTLDSYDYPELEEMHSDEPVVDFSDNGQNNGKSTSDVNVKKQPKPASATPTTKKKFPVLPIALLAALLAGGGGLFLWDRSMQEQKIAEAREIVATVPDLKQLNKKDALNDAKSKLSSAIARLEEIPERPGSLFDEAQTELGLLRTKVTAIDKKLATSTVATNPPGKTNTPPPKKTDTPPVSKTTPPTATVPAKVDPTVKPPAKTDDLEAAAKHLGHEASVIVQNAPHKSEVWKSAQGKWQEAIALLEKLPKETPQRASIDKRLGIYKQNLAQITTQLQKQEKVEGIIALLDPAAQTELKQLKTKGAQKPQFITACGGKIRSIPNADEVEAATCEFLFKSL
jgi:hypothetical protein